MPTISIKLPC